MELADFFKEFLTAFSENFEEKFHISLVAVIIIFSIVFLLCLLFTVIQVYRKEFDTSYFKQSLWVNLCSTSLIVIIGSFIENIFADEDYDVIVYLASMVPFLIVIVPCLIFIIKYFWKLFKEYGFVKSLIYFNALYSIGTFAFANAVLIILIAMIPISIAFCAIAGVMAFAVVYSEDRYN